MASFYIKITTYYLPFKFESRNEDRWSNFEKIFIFVLSNGVFPMLLTENRTNDTCRTTLARAIFVARGNDISVGTQKLRLLRASSLSVYILSVTLSTS